MIVINDKKVAELNDPNRVRVGESGYLLTNKFVYVSSGNKADYLGGFVKTIKGIGPLIYKNGGVAILQVPDNKETYLCTDENRNLVFKEL